METNGALFDNIWGFLWSWLGWCFCGKIGGFLDRKKDGGLVNFLISVEVVR